MVSVEDGFTVKLARGVYVNCTEGVNVGITYPWTHCDGGNSHPWANYFLTIFFNINHKNPIFISKNVLLERPSQREVGIKKTLPLAKKTAYNQNPPKASPPVLEMFLMESKALKRSNRVYQMVAIIGWFVKVLIMVVVTRLKRDRFSVQTQSTLI